jgi:peptidoglycan-N-acetylglucosamine deacetylase
MGDSERNSNVDQERERSVNHRVAESAKHSSATKQSSSHPDHRWHPSQAIWFSIALHITAAMLLLWRFELWPWLLPAIVLNHLVLTAAGLWPRSTLLGPNILRLPQAARARNEIALTFDDGPDPDVTPRVLDLLDRFGAKASFFCVGRQAALHPQIVREIVRRGHSVENHTEQHANVFAFYGLARLRREIHAAQQRIERFTGRAPEFFRAPAGIRSPLLEPILASLGLRYISWTRRGFDAVERDAAKVLQRLSVNLAAGDVLLLHDGSLLKRRAAPPVILEVLPVLLERIAARGLCPVSLPMAFGD